MHRSGLKIQISHRPKELPQLKSAEDELIQSINVLKSRNRIYGNLPTLDNVLDPPEEAEIRQIDVFSTGEKGEEEIVDTVHHEMGVARGEVIEIDLDEEDNTGPEPSITRAQATPQRCYVSNLQGRLLEYGEAEDISELSKRLCRFRASLLRQELANAK